MPCSTETKLRISQAKLGKRRTAESIYKQSQSLKGHVHSLSTRKKISKSNIGKHIYSSDVIQKIKETRKLTYMYKPRSDQFKRQKRLETINRIIANNGVCFPNYNRSACEYFKQLDTHLKTNGQYAVYGGGEHFIKNLGYFVDYINFDKKVIIEWYERRHFLPEKIKRDKRREYEIKQTYPEFLFITIKETEPKTVEDISLLIKAHHY
jgi:hypothetical protein